MIGSPDIIIVMYKHLRVTVCCIMWKLYDGKLKLYSVNLYCIGRSAVRHAYCLAVVSSVETMPNYQIL